MDCETDAEGKHGNCVRSGFRNDYDMALNADGELFTYDADWNGTSGCLGIVRPACHAVSGAEFGWRAGTAVATYGLDSLPP